MAEETERLVVALEARVRDFERNFEKANRTAQKQFAAIERRSEEAATRIERSMASASSRSNAQLERLGKGLSAAGAALKASLAGFAAGVAGGISLDGITKSIADLAEVNDVAERTGASAKFIQEFGFAVRQSGGDAEDANKGLQKFAVNASKAAQGTGDLAKLFEANGVALTDQTGKLRPLSDLLGDVAELIKNATSEQDRLNIASMAFGKSGGPALVLALAEGKQGLADLAAQANKAGAVLGDKLVSEAAKLDDQLTELQDGLSGIGKQLAVEFAGPVLSAALGEFLTQLREAKALIDGIRSGDMSKVFSGWKVEGGILGFFRGDYNAAPGADADLKALETRAKDLQSRIAEASKLPENTPGKALVENYKRELDGIEHRIDELKKRAADFTPSRVGYTASGLPTETPGKPTVLPASGEGGDDGGSAAQSKVFKLIAEFEAFRAKAYWDVDHYRVGYGSDTTTRADGSVSRTTQDTVVSMADATRDLSRRIADFQTGVRGKLGASTFDAMSEEQQAAMTSIAYNYGELPDRIVKAILGGGSTKDVATAISGLGRDNGGVNQRRRDEEAELFSGNATFSQKARDQASDTAADAATRKAEAIKRVIDTLTMEGAQLSRTEQQQRLYQELQSAGVDLSSKEGQAIAAKVQQLYELKTAQEAAAASTAQANKAREAFASIGADATKGFVSDLRSGVSAAQAFANALNRIADRLIDMAIDNIFKNAFAAPAGGAAGGGIFGALGKLFGFKDGGIIDVSQTPGYATGGYISGPGGPRSDSILARLSDGEYVVNAEATKKHRPVLEALNSGRVPAFASGGPVGRAGGKGMMRGGGDVNIRGGDITVQMQGSSGDARKDREHQEGTAKALRSAMREEMAAWAQNEMRPGGMLTKA